MQKKSQKEQIISYLKRGGKLTTLKALRWWGCFRLAAQIRKLRNQGHNIDTKLVKTKTGKWVAEYSL